MGVRLFISKFFVFSKDEKAFLEPQTDLLAVGLAVIGFVVFVTLLSRTYLGYEERSFALENYESATLLAETLSGNEVFQAEGETPGFLTAVALDELAGPSGKKARDKLFAGFSGNYVFRVEVRTDDGDRMWSIEPEGSAFLLYPGSRDRVAASVPVAIELNPAKTVPGTLTVVLFDTGWI